MNKQKSESVRTLESLGIGTTTKLKLYVWRIRRYLRDHGKKGKDILDVEVSGRKGGKAIRKLYRSIDKFMANYFPNMVKTTPKDVAVKRVEDMLRELNYTIVDSDVSRPWGAFFRMADSEVERFIHEFFPGLSLHDAKLGHDNTALSPKFLLVSPGQRLSWQYHDRRAERWRFLSKGAYFSSNSNVQGQRKVAEVGKVLQFSQGERHRLCAYNDSSYVIVAEIWQHTNPGNPSDETDIIRLEDDYERANN